MSDNTHTAAIIAICALCTCAERFLPFVIFSKRKPPKAVLYLGRVLPTAVMTVLVVYCLRNTNFFSPSGFVPQLVATAVTAVLHLLKGNTLLSVFGGTAFYMLLLRIV